jgi:uncharacterized membrane protein
MRYIGWLLGLVLALAILAIVPTIGFWPALFLTLALTGFGMMLGMACER